MAARYHLIGGPFEVYDSKLSGDAHLSGCVLGAPFEMDEEVASRAIVDGAALLPAESYDEIGFTADELKNYPNARAQASAPVAMQQKLLAARIALHDYRAQLAQES